MISLTKELFLGIIALSRAHNLLYLMDGTVDYLAMDTLAICSPYQAYRAEADFQQEVAPIQTSMAKRSRPLACIQRRILKRGGVRSKAMVVQRRRLTCF